MGANLEKAIEQEVLRVLLDPAFKRAPVQSALLRYLARRTCEGSAENLTQYDIAVEGLGKPNDFDETLDSSVRVKISRLRAALENYYSRNEPVAEGCVYIRPGDYRVRIGSRNIAYPIARPMETIDGASQADHEASIPPETTEHPISTPPSTTRALRPHHIARSKAFAVGALAMFGVGLIMAPRFAPDDDKALRSSTEINRPFVGYQIERVGFATNDSRFDELEYAATASVETVLARSITAYLTEPGEKPNPDYSIRLLFDRDRKNKRFADIQLVDRLGRTVYAERRDLPVDAYAAAEILKEELAAIFAPPGVLARHLSRNISSEPRNGFECLILIEVGSNREFGREELIDACKAKFSDSEYLPFIEARSLFWAFQAEMAKNGWHETGSNHWLRLRALLREYPENPYLNTLAAKVLIGRGECLAARPFTERFADYGNLFPALELMIGTELSGCDLAQDELVYWGQRTRDILAANREPHAMLQLYEITALLAYDQVEKVALMPPHPFTPADSEAMERLIEQLRGAAVNRTPLAEQEGIKNVVWNRNARERIVDALDQKA